MGWLPLVHHEVRFGIPVCGALAIVVPGFNAVKLDAHGALIAHGCPRNVPRQDAGAHGAITVAEGRIPHATVRAGEVVGGLICVRFIRRVAVFSKGSAVWGLGRVGHHPEDGAMDDGRPEFTVLS